MHDMGYIDDIAIPVNNNGKVVGADFDAESWDIWTNLTGYELYEIYTDVAGNSDLTTIVKQMIVNELKHRIQDDVWNGTDSKDSMPDNQWKRSLKRVYKFIRGSAHIPKGHYLYKGYIQSLGADNEIDMDSPYFEIARVKNDVHWAYIRIYHDIERLTKLDIDEYVEVVGRTLGSYTQIQCATLISIRVGKEYQGDI